VRSPRKVTLLSLFPSVEQLVVYADKKLTAFVALEAVIRGVSQGSLRHKPAKPPQTTQR